MNTSAFRNPLIQIIGIIGALLTGGCTQQKDNSWGIDIGKAYNQRTPVMANEYFSSIEYIPLETRKE